jgi:hypothetical protein
MPMQAESLAEKLGTKHGKQTGKLAVTEWFDKRTV